MRGIFRPMSRGAAPGAQEERSSQACPAEAVQQRAPRWICRERIGEARDLVHVHGVPPY